MATFHAKMLDYLANGIAVFSEEDEFLSMAQWDALERTIVDMTYASVTIGDAGEINSLDVARFMTDVQDVKVVDEPSTKLLLETIGAPNLNAFYHAITGFDQIFIRRAQVNRMRSNSYIGEHIDRDSNPDYSSAIVLQFGQRFTGGDFVVRGENGAPVRIVPTYRSAVITRCDLPHRVEMVTAGERISLVYFLSCHGGSNKRYL